MPDLSTLLVFAAACVALTATPGPDMLLIASRSLSQGRAAGFVTLAGIQLGTYIHALAAALGLSQLFVLVPVAYDVVRWAGAFYLAYLAWKALRASGPEPHAPRTKSRPLGKILGEGLLTNLLNPKMALFVLALFPQFLAPDAGSITVQVLVLATVLNGIGLVTNGCVILAAGKVGRYLASKGGSTRWPNYLLGAVFAGLALRLAASSRP